MFVNMRIYRLVCLYTLLLLLTYYNNNNNNNNNRQQTTDNRQQTPRRAKVTGNNEQQQTTNTSQSKGKSGPSGPSGPSGWFSDSEGKHLEKSRNAIFTLLRLMRDESSGSMSRDMLKPSLRIVHTGRILLRFAIIPTAPDYRPCVLGAQWASTGPRASSHSGSSCNTVS